MAESDGSDKSIGGSIPASGPPTVEMLKDKTAYDAAIAATNGGPALIVDFTATWCPPCKMIGPIFVQLASENPTVTMKKVDVDENAEAAAAAGIQAMPTFKVYKDGAEVEQMQGASKDGLAAMVAKYK